MSFAVRDVVDVNCDVDHLCLHIKVPFHLSKGFLIMGTAVLIENFHSHSELHLAHLMSVELLEPQVSLVSPQILSSSDSSQASKVSIGSAHLLPEHIVRPKSNPWTPLLNNVHLTPGVQSYNDHNECSDQSENVAKMSNMMC